MVAPQHGSAPNDPRTRRGETTRWPHRMREALLNILRSAVTELRTPRGAIIGLAALTAMYVLLSTQMGAFIVGVVSLAGVAIAALAWSSKRRRARSVEEPRSMTIDSSQANPKLDRARRYLVDLAARLKLEGETPTQSVDAVRYEPLVSVIVPCFNDAAYVRDAMESIRRQTYENLECVVVDDGSSDSSFEIISQLASSDRRFRPIRLDRNVGSGAARNHGLEAARGQLVAFLDADDMLLSDSIEKRAAVLARHVADPYVAGSFCAIRSSPEDIALDNLPLSRQVKQPKFIDFVTPRGECPFTLHAPLVVLERIRRQGGFNESMTSGAVDWDLWYRILRNGYVFLPSGFLGAIYRQKRGGITRGNKAGHTRASAHLIRSAYEPADPQILVDPSPFPMPASLGAYEATLVIADRAVRFAAMGLAEGRVDTMHETLRQLEGGTWPLLDRHLDWFQIVARGTARIVGLRPQDMMDLRDELSVFVSAVRNATKDASS